MALTVPKALINGHVYHKPTGVPYAHGCNRESIRDAARTERWDGIDLDINPNKELTPFVHHQLYPTKKDAWYDPKHHINDSHSCRKLSDEQMSRLRVRYQGVSRPILTARQAAVFCRDVNHGPLIPCFEAKGRHPCYLDPHWWYREFVKGIPGSCHVVIMTLPGTRDFGLQKLEAAHEAGLPTMWLWRGETAATKSKAFRDAVDLVKSRPGRGIYRI